MKGLKYLWISNCDILDIKYTSTNLIALAVRWSNIDSSLLLDQSFLSYLDVRTINKPLIGASSLSYLGITPDMPNRLVFSCEHDVLLTTLKKNKELMVLKLNITNGREHFIQRNIYEDLPNLKSLEFVDLTCNQNHAQYLTSLKPLREIIISSFETGEQEGTYEEALRIIAAMPEQKPLTIQDLNDRQKGKIVYDGIKYRLSF